MGTKILLLAAMVGTVVELAKVVGDRAEDAEMIVPVGNGITESTPLDGRLVLMDYHARLVN
jgi:hypothetical protein